MTQAKQQDKIQEIMCLIRSMSDADFYAGECTGRADFTGAAKHEGDSSVIERAIQSKLRELVREPLSHDDANKLWEDCLKKYKRPGPYELIVEFCNITSASGEV